MHRSIVQAASLLLAIGAVVADDPYTTITPCPACPTDIAPEPIVVTEQYQVVSTCEAPTSTCEWDSCSTSWPYTSYTYVSTAIPCAYDVSTATTTTVTVIDQIITVSVWSTVLTSMWTPSPSALPWWMAPSSTPVYRTVAREYGAPYNNLGPLAMPGWEGSGLCTDCEEQDDGSTLQALDVTECKWGWGMAGPDCSGYEETWVSTVAPSTTSAAVATCPYQGSVESAGVYTFTFPQWAPPATITSAAQTWEVDGYPWFAYATQTADGPTSWDFTIEFTNILTWNVPYQTNPASTSWSAPVPSTSDGNEWFPWIPATTSTAAASWSGYPTSSGYPYSTTSYASTTTTTTTTTTSSGTPANTPVGPFYLQVTVAGAKYHRRAIQYVGFSQDDGIVVTGQADAALVVLGGGILQTGGQFIGADTLGYQPFQKYTGEPTYPVTWNYHNDGTVTFDNPLFTYGGESAVFCEANDGSLFMELTTPTGFECHRVILSVATVNTGTTTTTTTTTTTPVASDGPDATGTRRRLRRHSHLMPHKEEDFEFAF